LKGYCEKGYCAKGNCAKELTLKGNCVLELNVMGLNETGLTVKVKALVNYNLVCCNWASDERGLFEKVLKFSMDQRSLAACMKVLNEMG